MARMTGEITQEELSQELSNEIGKIDNSLHIREAVERDFNTYVNIGLYRITNNDMANKPPFEKVQYGILEVIPIPSSTAIRQRAHDMEFNCTWFRSKASPSLPWSKWEREARISDVSNPNLFINGGFDVWQEGDNFSNLASAIKYCADQWIVQNYAGGMRALRIVGNVNDKNIMQLTMPKETSWNRLRQPVELIKNRMSNTKLTLSMNCHSNQNVAVKGYFGYYEGGVYKEGLNGFLNTTQVNQYSTYSMTLDITGLVIDNDKPCLVGWQVDTTGLEEDIVLHIKHMKLEFGEVSTAFVPKTYAQELQDCQRYFEVIYPMFDVMNRIFNCYKGLVAQTATVYPVVKKRIKPTYSFMYINNPLAPYDVSYANEIGGGAMGIARVEIEPSTEYDGFSLCIKDLEPVPVEGQYKSFYMNGSGKPVDAKGIKAVVVNARIY